MTTRYELIIFWSNDDESFAVEGPELPGCMADGPNLCRRSRKRRSRHRGMDCRNAAQPREAGLSNCAQTWAPDPRAAREARLRVNSTTDR